MKSTRKSVKTSRTLKCLFLTGQKLRNLLVKLKSKWMREQMNNKREQSKVGKNLRKSLIRNKRVSGKQLTRAKRGSKRGSSVKKKLSRKESKNKNLRKL